MSSIPTRHDEELTPSSNHSNLNSQIKNCFTSIMPISERQRRAAVAASPSISTTNISANNTNSRVNANNNNELSNSANLRTPYQYSVTGRCPSTTWLQATSYYDHDNHLQNAKQNDTPSSSRSNGELQKRLRELYESRSTAPSPAGGQVYRQPSSTRISPSSDISSSSRNKTVVIPATTRTTSSTSMALAPGERIPKSVRRQIRSIVESELNHNNNSSTGSGGDNQLDNSIHISPLKIIQRLEEHLKEAQLKIHEKDCEILSIRQELTFVRKMIEEISAECKSSKTLYGILKYDFMGLEKQLEMLQEKVSAQEMKQSYLLNHQMTKSSRSTTSSSSSSSSEAHNNSTTSTTEEQQSSILLLDYDKLIQSIRELNAMIGSNSDQSVELCYNSYGATFKLAPQAITLTLYKNGILLDIDKKFRSFSSSETTSFIQDIYDGYFPSELQTKFPNGILLIVDDYRTIEFSPTIGEISARRLPKSLHPFTGKGYRLASSTPPDKSTPSSARIAAAPVPVPKLVPGMKYNCMKAKQSHKSKSEANQPRTRCSSASFSDHQLNNKFQITAVPKLIEPTSSLSSSIATVSTSSLSVSVEQLPDLCTNSSSVKDNGHGRCSSSQKKKQTIILKLRNVVSNGKQYKLTVNVNSTIEDINRHLSKYIPNNEADDDDGFLQESDWNENPYDDDLDNIIQKYELINSLPFGVLDSPSSTLKDYKITSNSLVYFRKTCP